MNISVQQGFEEKMKERIRASINDLMPDEMLQELVKRGIEEAFFKQTVKEDNYGRKVLGNSWLHDFIKDELKLTISKHVTTWLKENDEKLQTIMKEVLCENIGQAVIAAFATMVRQPFEEFKQNLEQRLIRGY